MRLALLLPFCRPLLRSFSFFFPPATRAGFPNGMGPKPDTKMAKPDAKGTGPYAAGEDAEKVAASARAFQGHFTRALRAVENLLLLADADPDNRTSVLAAQLVDARDKMLTVHSKLEARLSELIDLKPDEAEEFEGLLNQFQDRRDDMITRIVQVLNTCGTPAPAPLAAPHHAPASVGAVPRTRVAEALKPEPLTKDNTPLEFTVWLERFRAFYLASALDRTSVEEQQAYFKNCLDPHLSARLRNVIQVNTPIYGDADSCMSALEDEFKKLWPPFQRRLEFFRYDQPHGQAFSDWVAELRARAAEADLEHMTAPDIFVMRLICGIADKKLKEKFLREEEPTMENLIRIGTANEVAKSTLKAITTPATAASTSSGQKSGQNNIGKGKKPTLTRRDLAGRCYRCGASNKKHTSADCPARSATCSKCSKEGHLANVCMSKPDSGGKGGKSKTTSRKQSRAASPAKDKQQEKEDKSKQAGTTSTATVFVRATTASRPTPAIWLHIGQHQHAALPDTGAMRTVISADLVRKYGFRVDRTRAEPLKAANHTPMDCLGSALFDARHGEHSTTIDALVSSSIKGTILVSWHDLIALGVLRADFPAQIRTCSAGNTMHSIMQEYDDVFSNAVKPMAGPPMVIHLTDNVKPHRVMTARQVPLHLREAADKLVEKLVQEGIIARVTEPTDHVSAGFFVPKEGKVPLEVRLVTDYIPLNKSVRRPIHPFPTARDILQSISPQSRYFAKLDCVHGYFQIPLEESSSFLTTFLLPSGRYRYLRAPMGLSASSDEWCARSDAALHGLEGVLKIVDDILVQAPTEPLLLQRLGAVLDRCRQHGITLSKKKLAIGSQVSFAGYTIGSTGITPDPSKVAAIRDFPAPTDLTELRSFLGMANQLAHFVPDLAHATTPLRLLLKKNVAWTWLDDQDNAFRRTKEILTSPLTVAPFDPSLQTQLLTDASRLHGLGYALLQHGPEDQVRMIQAGSRSLSPAEKNYATIELEALGILYAVKHCRHYLFGSTFTVITDHRPLLGTFSKPLELEDNKRLARFREQLAGYTFHLEWAPGKDHQIADALSRAPHFGPDEPDDGDHAVTLSAVSADPALQALYDAAEADDDYQAVLTALQADKEPKHLPTSHPARDYASIWTNLSVHDDMLLMYGDRIVVPFHERTAILELLHTPHAGVSRTRKAAQRLYFWPGLNADIKRMIDACQECQALRPSQAHEPLQPTAPASEPMQRVSTDLFQLHGCHYLLMVDRHSGFPWVAALASLTTKAVTAKLAGWFCDFGRPAEIYSDGGPQYRTEFRTFCSKMGIKHVTSSPYHPRSNGLAEAAVKQVKHLLTKHGGNFNTFHAALAAWRNTPRSRGPSSPAELFFGRRLRGELPQLRPLPAHRHVPGHLTPLTIGDRVRIQDPLTLRWTDAGTIVGIRASGRSYSIADDDGFTFIRNRRLLKPLPDADSAHSSVPHPEGEKTDTSKHETTRRSARLATQRRVRFEDGDDGI